MYDFALNDRLIARAHALGIPDSDFSAPQHGCESRHERVSIWFPDRLSDALADGTPDEILSAMNYADSMEDLWMVCSDRGLLRPAA